MSDIGDTQPLIVDGRFRFDQLLQFENGVHTFTGRELRTNIKVVGKVAPLAALQPGLLARLRHECEVLRALYQGQSRLIELVCEDDRATLVASFIEGTPLDELMRGGVSLTHALAMAHSLASDLVRIHDAGILHRDLKPSNVVIAPDGHHAHIIDFGFSRSCVLATGTRGNLVGTALYMSPEASGLLHHDVDERADLYSFGIILYELLTGEPPFTGATVGDVLHQHLNDLPTALVTTAGGEKIPAILQNLMARLLRKDPLERYQTARALADDLSQLRTALARSNEEPHFTLGATDERSVLTEPAFVGRAQELRFLRDRFEKARTGEPQLVLVEGESGSGKSRLLEEFAHSLDRRHAWILRAQGIDQSAQRPFHSLQTLIKEITARWRHDEAYLVYVRERLGDRAAALTSFVPELSEWFAPTTGQSLGPDAFGEQRYIQSMATFFSALGEPTRPVIVAIDDCQWADELTIKFVQYWKTLELAYPHIMLLAAFRSEEIPEHHALRLSTPDTQLKLTPLDGSSLLSFAKSMAGELPEPAYRLLEELSNGSPFMASAVLRGLVESHVLYHSQGQWKLDERLLGRIQSSRRAAAFLTRRLELLSPSSLDILTVGAVIGKEFSLDLAAKVADKSSQEVITAVANARRRGILWERNTSKDLRFVHDKLRESLLARIDERMRRSLHEKIALRADAEKDRDPFFLAFHFDAAARHHDALPHALEAARRSRKVFSLDLAEEYFRIARRCLVGDAQDPRNLEVALGLGDVLMLRGNYDEAHTLFETSLELARSTLDMAEIQAKIGELEFKRGDMGKAAKALEAGLSVLGRSVPSSPIRLAMALAGEVLIQCLHTLFPRLFVARKSGEVSSETRIVSHLYSRLAYAYWFASGKLACAWVHLRNMNLMEGYPPTAELAQVYSEHAPVMTMIPLYKRGLKYVERSLAMRRSFGDVWGQGQSLNFKGILLYASSRFEEAAAICEEAMAILERTGDQWETNTAGWHVAYAKYRLGDLDEAVRWSQRIFRRCQTIGDHSSLGIILSVWAKAQGHPPEAVISEELTRKTDDVHTRSELLQAKALAFFRIEEWARAEDTLREAIVCVEKAGLRQEYVAPLWPWLATVLRKRLQACSFSDRARGRHLLLEAKAAVRKAHRIARYYRNNLPQTLREEAYIAAAEGRFKRARRALTRSLSIAAAQNARHERLLTRLAFGEIGIRAGWPHAASERDAARHELALLEGTHAAETPVRAPPLTVAFLNRFDTLLTGGRRIASALDHQEIVSALWDLIASLFHSRSSLVLEVSESPEGEELLTILHPSREDATFSQTIARKAIREGKTALYLDAPEETAGASIILSDIRSVLCAPITVNGRVKYLIYIQNTQSARVFGDDEAQLAEFIAAIAGASLETSVSYRRLDEVRTRQEQQLGDLMRAQEDLKAAWLAAETASRSKSDFLAKVSHELRTPLGAIMGFSEILLNPAYNHTNMVTYLDIIRRNSTKLLSIINDILDLSKVEAGKMDVEVRPYQLEAEFKDVLQLFEGQAKEQGTTLSMQLDSSIPDFITSDPLRMRQVLLNLVANALKFTQQGRVDVHAALVKQDDGRVILAVDVRDSGIGIPEEKQRELFQPFSQVDNSPSRKYGGTGLGLSLSKQLAQLIGGDVVLHKSTPGQGSTFRFTFDPFMRPTDPTVEAPEASAKTAPAQPLANRKVLFVEDNEENHILYGSMLERAGATVDLANDGEQAIRLATSGRYDLILMDMQMPVMDGYAATKTLRGKGFTAPIVALTAHAMAEDRIRCLNIGCNDYLSKPADDSTLISILEGLMAQGHA